MSEQLSEFLAEKGLEQYQALLEENDVDLDVLGELTDADLKEIGISSLGHRRKLLSSATAPPPQEPPQPAVTESPKTKANQPEETVFERSVNIWNSDFSQLYKADVRITNRRVILGSKTYALQNIDVVSVGNNQATVRALAEQDGQRAVVGYGALVLGIGAFWLWWVIAVFFIVIGLIILGLRQDFAVSYSVRIGSSADGNAFFTQHKSDAVEIVDALNEAIVSLDM